MMFLYLLIIGVWSVEASTFFNINGWIPEVPDFQNGVSVYQNKCIEDLGCFYTGPPFHHPLNRPKSLMPRSNLKTKFLLYTPSNTQDGEELNFTPNSIERSSFDPELPVKVLIHGFLSDLKDGDIRFEIKDAFLKASDYNIIVVDWTEHNGPPYARAVANIRVIGAQLAKLLKLMMETTGLKAENIHIIGHSLGAQMAGYTGERIPNLGRITGLDPAGPYFQDGANEIRLDATDATFVDVIHTDGSENFIEGLGIGDPVGHMDFYPNGGTRQPGCVPTAPESKSFVGSMAGSLFNYTTKWLRDDCDHSRANNLFLESIDNSKCRFLATWCNSYDDFEKGDCLPQNSTLSEMGLHAKRIPGLPIKSKFFLRTSDESPYCIESSVFLRNDE